MLNNKIIKGDYIKPSGSDWILFYDGKKWVSCECLGCAYAMGLINHRLSASDYPKLAKRLGYNFQIKHDKLIHNNWIKSEKPIINKG